VRKELASLVDIYPTCLDLAGIETPPPDTQGASLNGLLQGRSSNWRDSAFVEFYGLYAGTAMVTCRSGDWKYGWNANGTDELYNLATDPYETKNLIGDPSCHSLCNEMLAKIAAHLPPGIRNEVQRRIKNSF
jgi:choline-sulfatase